MRRLTSRMASSNSSGELIELVVCPSHADCRLDWFLAQQLPAYSRTLLRRAINAVGVRVDGKRVKASHRLRAGERITLALPELPRPGPQPEDIPLDVLYEDEWIAVINKGPGMVVHPARGHWSGTLASALRFHFEELSEAGGATRPGIVHRLDRDTSGVIVVAKQDPVHRALAGQFADRSVEKQYFAIVAGVPGLDRDLIDAPIGPHPTHREKMAIRRDHPASRPAQTFFEVLARFDGFAAVRVLPKTGRTHQIRVHLSSIGCPVLCDRLYGGRAVLTRGQLCRRPDDDELLLARQALHAWRLRMAHPQTGAPLDFEAPLPDDIERTLRALGEIRGR